ncbi:hypothetical protein OQA88_1232 [Cercophora sp. LCS_1]
MPPPHPPSRILISGAGLSSLSFALSLSRLWPSSLPRPHIILFERDTPSSASAALRRQGYTLSLAGIEEASGLAALRDLGLLDETLACAVAGSEQGRFKIWGPDWREWMSVKGRPVKGVPVGAVRVRRKDLRRVLLDAVGRCEGVEVRWGVMVVGAAERRGDGDGRVEVRVRSVDGEGKKGEERVEVGGLLVVADGASSKVRKELRKGDGLDYAGAVQLAGVGKFEEGIPEPVNTNWGLQLSGEGVCCFYSPSDEKNVLWSLSFLEEQGREKRSYATGEEMQLLLEEARERGKAFGELFRRIVDATEDPATTMCLPAQDKKPFRHDAGTRIVFIGDSNHAVSPFAGYGANLALRDGWDLAQCLVETPSIEAAVKQYDVLSYPRAVKILEASRWRIKNGHSTGLRFWLFGLFISFGGFVLRTMGKS